MDLLSSLTGIRSALIAMSIVLLVEMIVPLYKRTAWNWRHLVPNLFLAFITFGMGLLLNLGVLAALVWLHAQKIGIFNVLTVSPWIEVPTVLLVLDFAWYLTHVSMHKSSMLWRFHATHHSDLAVDVTTTYRQHPVEGLVRYGFLTVFAVAVGASPSAFAFYRVWTVFAGQAEHANIRLPQWLGTAISLVTMSPIMHKVHHSRDPRFTDTNYSQIFSMWDRIFGTCTPARFGRGIDFGFNGYDGKEYQSSLGLLRMPLRRSEASSDPAPTGQFAS